MPENEVELICPLGRECYTLRKTDKESDIIGEDQIEKICKWYVVNIPTAHLKAPLDFRQGNCIMIKLLKSKRSYSEGSLLFFDQQFEKLNQADQIRDYVIKNYIEPARKKGLKEVTIIAGDVAREVTGGTNIPNVNNVLRGKKLLTMCNIRLIKKQGPYESTTTSYTYNIEIGI